MSLTQFLSALLGRYKLVLFLFFGSTAVAVTVFSRLPVQYTATTSVLVDVRAADPLTALIMPNNLATQVDIITGDRVSRKVVKMLKLDENSDRKSVV